MSMVFKDVVFIEFTSIYHFEMMMLLSIIYLHLDLDLKLKPNYFFPIDNDFAPEKSFFLYRS